MRLLKAVFINRAPFEKLVLDFDDENVSVLSGINGRGKTTILSHIVDAFYELAKKGFPNEFENKQNKFYRVSSDINAVDDSKPSIVFFEFKDTENVIEYIDVRGKLIEDDYQELVDSITTITFSEIKTELENNSCIKYCKIDKAISNKLFANNLLTYFPAYRYECPAYLNDIYRLKLNFRKEMSFSGYLENPLEVITGISEIANWIMDVVLDVSLYGNEREEHNVLIRQINSIITNILHHKFNGYAGVGVGPRNYGAIRLQIIDKDGQQVYPSVFSMSAGELSLLCIFGEILRQTDRINYIAEKIEGIVLVDEIDKHLHMKLQKETLPTLFKMFPDIQFIVTSHSPFLNMGLDECDGLKYSIFDLDNEGLRCEPVNNELVKEVYDLILGQNANYATKYQELKRTIDNGNKPLIITEGKTDWKHLKAAMRELEITSIDVEFYEYDDTIGDSKLLTMLENFAKTGQSRKIIGMFDRDNSSIMNKVTDENIDFKRLGKNVYAFVIPAVNTNLYGDEISIEHYYLVDDLTKVDNDGRRLFWGKEFHASGCSTNGEYRTKFSNIQNYAGKAHIIDDKVYKSEDLEEKTNVALTKNRFAEYIYENNEYAHGFDFSNFRMIFDVIQEICAVRDDV